MPSRPDRNEVEMDVREDPEVLPVKEFIQDVDDWISVAETKQSLASQAANVSSRTKVVYFLLMAYGALLASTMLIFFLQSSNSGDSPPESILKWLGAATVGGIAGLLTIAIEPLFEV